MLIFEKEKWHPSKEPFFSENVFLSVKWDQSTVWARITWGFFAFPSVKGRLEARLLVQIVNKA
jgi:hypothetical protein